MPDQSLYAESFYKRHRDGALASAREVVPIVIELLRPRSVIDVGCGSGVWLSVFKQHGVDDIFGIDGDHVPRSLLEIPNERFAAHDLTQRFEIGRRYDVVLSLEVAEHLPASASDRFVDSLVSVGSNVVFSAAIPDQGGEGHINEQWPDYWIERFRARGYDVVDCLRPRFWTTGAIEWWYAQNMFLFVERSRLQAEPRLLQELDRVRAIPTSLVHPRHYVHAIWRENVLRAALEIVDIVPAGESFILLDEDQFGYEFGPQRRVMRYAASEQWYWESPPNGEGALRELHRLESEGARFMVVGWPAFGWLDARPPLKTFLRSNCRCIAESERVLVFGL